MSKMLKSLMHSELQSRLKGVEGGVFITTQGLNSEKTYNFRKTLHEAGVKYTVVRNAFASQVLGSLGYDRKKLDSLLVGSVGVAYTTEENSATVAAKVIAEWKRDSKDKIIQWKGAFVDGQLLGAAGAEQLKDAPSKDQARAMLLGIIQAPAAQLLATIREPHARIVYLLNAWKDKREESGAA